MAIINMVHAIDGMVVCHFPYGPTTYFSLHNVVLRHDIKDQGTVSEAFPHLIFHNFSSRLGQRVSDAGKNPYVTYSEC